MNAFFTPGKHLGRRGTSRQTQPNESRTGTDQKRDLGHCDLAHSSVLLTEALAAAHSAPDVREDKVAAIKARLAAGTYRVDTAHITEALLRENPELFR